MCDAPPDSASNVSPRTGMRVRVRRNVIELFGSMRFAIALFVLLAIASVIGTVLAQGAPYADYVSQFGPFWANIFRALGLYAVYDSWWFVLILCFLVASISVCAIQRVRVPKTNAGYFLAHGAIVLICIGGLLDSSLPVRLQAWLLDKTPVQRDIASNGIGNGIAPQHRLPASTLPFLSFRGNAWVPQGQTVSSAILNGPEGSFVQDLPFAIRLNHFIADYYTTGMPKRFASDIVVIDKHNGKQIPAHVEVNQPFEYDGVSIYQSGFRDSGSQLHITAWPMTGADAKGVPLSGVVGTASAFPAGMSGAQGQTIEFTGFASRASSRNVGPSMQYVVRDASGQAREYDSYMQPIDVDGAPMFVAGVRTKPDESFRYLRIPADEHGSVHEWMRLRAAFADPALRAEAARRFAARSVPAANLELRQHLQESATRILTLFAGAKADTDADAMNPASAHADAQSRGGFQAIAAFIAQSVPKDEQQKAAGLFWQMLDGATWNLWQLARARAGETPAPDNAHTQRFVADAMNAISDGFLYGSPAWLQLDSFRQVQASAFQVVRAPGRKLVYLGGVLLVAGIAMMFCRRGQRLRLRISSGGHWKSASLLMVGVAALSLLAMHLYRGDSARGESAFLLKYFLSSQSAILWMSALFVLATAFYWLGTFARVPAGGPIGSRLTWAAVLMGFTGMMVRWYESYLPGAGAGAGHMPVSNLYEVLVLFCLMTAWIYLYYERRYATRTLGAFVLPVISAAVIFLLWYALARGAQQIQPLVPALQSSWMKLHVPANFIGYGCFAFAAMAGLAYLLKAHGVLAERLPALDMLDDAMYHAIAIGFAFFTLATILGALWAAQAWGSYWSWDPKETWALIVWLNYAAWLHARRVQEWRGTVAAWWALTGLVVTTFAFLGVNLFLSGLHSYGGL